MDFALAPEYLELKRNVARFLEKELEPIAEEIDRESRFPMEVFRKAASLGYVGAHLPEEFGGTNDLMAKAVIHEENCRVCLGYNVTVNASDLIFANNLVKIGTQEQKEYYLPPVISGEKIGAWALTEPGSGSDALSIKTAYEEDGDRFVISGSKTLISNAPIADFFIILARKPGTKGIQGGTAFLLERGMEGLETGPPFGKLGCRCSPTGEIFLNEVRADRSQVLGEPEQGFHQMLNSLDIERALTPFSSIGVAQGCLDAAAKYATEREQFGRPLRKFQLVSEKVAEMAMNIDVARTYCYKLIWLAQQGKKITKEAAMAKLFASEMVNKAAAEAVQIFGGYGYIPEYPVERYFRDARLLTIGAGTSEIQKIVIAREVFKEYE